MINCLLYDPQHVPFEIHINVHTLAFYNLDQRSKLVNLHSMRIQNPDPLSTQHHPQDLWSDSDIMKQQHS